MEKKKIIALVVAAIVLIGAGIAVWYFCFREEETTTETKTDSSTTKSTEKSTVDRINDAIDGGQDILDAILN